jgi:hypothetical protein
VTAPVPARAVVRPWQRVAAYVGVLLALVAVAVIG